MCVATGGGGGGVARTGKLHRSGKLWHSMPGRRADPLRRLTALEKAAYPTEVDDGFCCVVEASAHLWEIALTEFSYLW